jgi:hypothetical protein
VPSGESFGMKIKRLLALVAAIICLLPPTAFAEEPDASTTPRTSGPIVTTTPGECEDNGPAGPQEVKGQSCSWAYQLLPAHTNATEDFLVYWMQMEIDPGTGWCAQRLEFDIELSDARIASVTPDKGQRIKQAEVTTTEFVVDGDGSAPVPGTIAQDVQVGKGRTTVSVDEQKYRFTWTGNTKEKVVIAVGVQIAYTRTPPGLFFSVSGGQGMGAGSCRPIIIRVRD